MRLIGFWVVFCLCIGTTLLQGGLMGTRSLLELEAESGPNCRRFSDSNYFSWLPKRHVPTASQPRRQRRFNDSRNIHRRGVDIYCRAAYHGDRVCGK